MLVNIYFNLVEIVISFQFKMEMQDFAKVKKIQDNIFT